MTETKVNPAQQRAAISDPPPRRRAAGLRGDEEVRSRGPFIPKGYLRQCCAWEGRGARPLFTEATALKALIQAVEELMGGDRHTAERPRALRTYTLVGRRESSVLSRVKVPLADVSRP